VDPYLGGDYPNPACRQTEKVGINKILGGSAEPPCAPLAQSVFVAFQFVVARQGEAEEEDGRKTEVKW